MGGEDIWSNGIHLNTIEHALNPADESWNNIMAINDLVYEVITTTSHYVISAIQGNAGAGGVVMALAADEVVAREGIVLNPHYKNMGLFGSEFWTYLLPKKVGYQRAFKLTNECHPLITKEAIKIGLIDRMGGKTVKTFRMFLEDRIEQLKNEIHFGEFTSQKRERLRHDQLRLRECRNKELQQMWDNFYNPESTYHSLRRSFVQKMIPIQ